MGATKRVAEKLIACANNTPNSQFMAVRFGNVIGSSGSVIPLFQEQIARGGPVTVTHPEVIRYFMSIPEAAQLILQAGSMGKGGEIFLLEMGKALRIADLAKDLIQLYGYDVGKDIVIQYTGLRPGEKLYEELYSDTELILETAHKSIMILQSSCDDPQRLQQQLEKLFNLSDSYDHERIKKMLQEIVPEYTAESHRERFRPGQL
jgi:FlaA1/EpsC-like NDP-sugar epimerase